MNAATNPLLATALLSILVAPRPCRAEASPAAVSLAGTWRVALDPTASGEAERWFDRELPGDLAMALPGTTDRAGIGHALDPRTMTYPVEVVRVKWPSAAPVRRADEAGHLVRERLFIGKAWYQRSFEAPHAWAGKHVRLRLERVLWSSKAWVDGRLAGECDSLVAPHVHDLGPLAPGTHRITLRIDNGLVLPIGVIGHAYGPETQSRWNGVVGALELVAADPVSIGLVRVWPAPDRRSARARIRLHNRTGASAAASLRLAVSSEGGGDALGAGRWELTCKPGEHEVERTVTLDREAEPWDEFRTARYLLRAEVEADLPGGRSRGERTEAFGFRTIERRGRQILVNGRRVFLRGTLDCCVYPKTGHPPVTVEEWLAVLSTIRDHGFNHVRYHTWCPPEAAFEAADRLGLYLAPETPFWVDDWTVSNMPTPTPPLGRDARVLDWVRREALRACDAYGNHPSFALFCLGNEFGMQGTDWTQVEDLLAEAKVHDDRRLYNASTARRRLPSDDYWATHSTGLAGTRGVGPPHTDWDFQAAAESADLPVVAHETGQRPVFPDYDAMLPEFTGPLKPRNYERLRDRLVLSGLAPQAGAFHRASARFQLVQYKAEHEAMLRTADSAGYQLLMLNDFTGQSEALVGILDPFWRSKGVVSAAEVRAWNAPIVPLARLRSHVWTTEEVFRAELEVAQYGPRDLTDVVAEWSLAARGGPAIASGRIGPLDLPAGRLRGIGTVRAPLAAAPAPCALVLSVSVADATNRWTVWAYPPPGAAPGEGPEPRTALVRRSLDAEALRALREGARVLVLAHGLENEHTATTGFLSVYWSAGWWGDRFSSLGLLCDPAHPALADFPNDGHSDWQWHELAEGATTFDLSGAPPDLRPIVQPVTDFHHVRLLGQVFEARVGEGRLLAVGQDIETGLERRHAARQLRRSLLRYVESDAFAPRTKVEPELAARWLAPMPEASGPEGTPDALDEAALDVAAAADLERVEVDVPWSRASDRARRNDGGYGWEVTGGGTWKDAVGSAWHGNPLAVRVAVPAGVSGTLLVHVHDWNELGRKGTVRIEGRAYRLGGHAGAGRWLAFEVRKDDTADGHVEVEARPSSGPNLMISRLVFVPE